MNKIPFRDTKPFRSYTGKDLSDYHGYKDFLETDFNQRCGYTHCHQFWFGGKRSFQIDHFKPKQHFPELENKYSNLVYSSSYINRAKWNDVGNYLDPCDTDYNEHFYRDGLGNIYPEKDSEAANYMYRKLKLYLKRYGIIWMLDQLEQRMYLLQELIEGTGNSEAKELFIEVSFRYNNYKKYLKAEQ